MSGITRLEGKGAGSYSSEGMGEGVSSSAPARGLSSLQRSKLAHFETTYQRGGYDRDRLRDLVQDFYNKYEGQMNKADRCRTLMLVGRVSTSVKELVSDNDSLETVDDADKLKRKTEMFLFQNRGSIDPKSAIVCENIIHSCEDFISERSGRVSPTKAILHRSFWEWNPEKTRLKAPSPGKLYQINVKETARSFRKRSGSVTGAEKEALKAEIDAFVKENGENISKISMGFIDDARRNLEEE